MEHPIVRTAFLVFVVCAMVALGTLILIPEERRADFTGQSLPMSSHVATPTDPELPTIVYRDVPGPERVVYVHVPIVEYVAVNVDPALVEIAPTTSARLLAVSDDYRSRYAEDRASDDRITREASWIAEGEELRAILADAPEEAVQVARLLNASPWAQRDMERWDDMHYRAEVSQRQAAWLTDRSNPARRLCALLYLTE